MSDAEDPCSSELTFGTELKPILEGAVAAKIIAVKKTGQVTKPTEISAILHQVVEKYRLWRTGQSSLCPGYTPIRSSSPLSKHVLHLLTIYLYIGRAEYASYTWRSAECLAQAIALGEISVTGKRILELGAGTGLCGLTALKCGATWTTFSDLRDEVIMESLDESCRKNEVTAFDFIASDWNNVPSELLNVDFDLILAADCMFDKKVFRPFAETVSFLLHKNPSAFAVVAYENRGVGLTMELVQSTCFDSDSLFLFKLTLKCI